MPGGLSHFATAGHLKMLLPRMKAEPHGTTRTPGITITTDERRFIDDVERIPLWLVDLLCTRNEAIYRMLHARAFCDVAQRMSRAQENSPFVQKRIDSIQEIDLKANPCFGNLPEEAFACGKVFVRYWIGKIMQYVPEVVPRRWTGFRDS